jgi:glycosyltransferase involved in cell wall biosynthesis
MSDKADLHALLVDPSLFTAPYDTALTHGLVSAGVDVRWATRPTREGDRQELPNARVDDFFYRRVDRIGWLPGPLQAVVKGIAHVAGLAELLLRVRRQRPDIVHFQWVVVPPLDLMAMALIRRWCPLVFTVHDTVPFNGQKMSWLQQVGHDGLLKMAHRMIVHTRSGRQALLARGVPDGKIVVIAHGPLQLAASPVSGGAPRDPRWTFLLFGEIKPYKGLDVLIEAFAQMPAELREAARVIVAGRPRMDLAPLMDRIQALGLGAQFDVRPQRQSEEQIAELFAQTDCVVFPYRQIDASGVYFLVNSLGKWLIASNVGVFAEEIAVGVDGVLVPRDDASALADAMAHAIRERPQGQVRDVSHSWNAIGQATKACYGEALLAFGAASQGKRQDTVQE